MLSLRKGQALLLAKQLSDGGNLAAAALVFGPFVSPRPFSPVTWLIGVVVWFGLAAIALFVAGRESE
jgi:hypothetical protein